MVSGSLCPFLRVCMPLCVCSEYFTCKNGEIHYWSTGDFVGDTMLATTTIITTNLIRFIGVNIYVAVPPDCSPLFMNNLYNQNLLRLVCERFCTLIFMLKIFGCLLFLFYRL